jgi:hypothetical protein
MTPTGRTSLSDISIPSSNRNHYHRTATGQASGVRYSSPAPCRFGLLDGLWLGFDLTELLAQPSDRLVKKGLGRLDVVPIGKRLRAMTQKARLEAFVLGVCGQQARGGSIIRRPAWIGSRPA